MLWLPSLCAANGRRRRRPKGAAGQAAAVASLSLSPGSLLTSIERQLAGVRGQIRVHHGRHVPRGRRRTASGRRRAGPRRAAQLRGGRARRGRARNRAGGRPRRPRTGSHDRPAALCGHPGRPREHQRIRRLLSAWRDHLRLYDEQVHSSDMATPSVTHDYLVREMDEKSYVIRNSYPMNLLM